MSQPHLSPGHHERQPFGPRSGTLPMLIGTLGCVLLGLVTVLGVLGVGVHAPSGGAEAHAHAPRGWLIGSLPFAGILLAIAVLPLVPSLAGWWHQNRNKLVISIVAAGATLLYLGGVTGFGDAAAAAKHAMVDEYIPFMALLFSLYVVTGGIAVEGDLVAQPRTTTAFLAFGACIASAVGTTGASMLLIRPLLSTIQQRRYRVHTIIFFIFLVSNIGGTLLPIGDPPLFMGFLTGIPFFWTLILWKEWAFCVGTLLVIYYVIESILWRREPVEALLADPIRRTRLTISGWLNVVWLAAIILTVAFVDPSKPLPGTSWKPFPFLREILLVGLAGLSMLLTTSAVRKANKFTFGAILEVAAVFLGIFVAMQVPLLVLHAKGGELGLTTPGQFFWLTGLLSSFLDNAPTYLVFLGVAMAMPMDPAMGNEILLPSGGHVNESYLVAISLGAVFMGANTYIGNGPNFMVKSIAEESGLKMPSFFGYMLWSAGILLPLFVLVHWLFL